MKYTYAYKTSDGTRHEATMVAESREAVFAALRAQGIRPIKVVADDGSKANGEVRGVRKRVVAAIACLVAAVVGTGVFVMSRAGMGAARGRDANGYESASTPRHQIYGDPVIVEEFERGRFEDVFTNRVDQMLAWFAQPGRLMCPKETDPRRCGEEFARAVEREREGRATGGTPVAPVSDGRDAHRPSVSDGQDAHRPSVSDGQDARRPSASDGRDAHRPSDSREVRELRQIVSGMREEMAAYLANGNGTPRSFWRRLLERTEREMHIYERTRRELEREKDVAVWEKKNESLRRIGLRTIPYRYQKSEGQESGEIPLD